MPKYGKKLLQNVSRTRIRILKLKYPLNLININMLKFDVVTTLCQIFRKILPNVISNHVHINCA